ncbi:MAG: HD domain-containing protein [Desulfuromonadaceae bacterium]|nr:HD domain-containing protein [Desulfuromonadaceae bacterium]
MSQNQSAAWQNFFRLLVTAASNTDLYSPQHPQVSRLVGKARELIGSLMGSDTRINIMLIDQNIILGKSPLPATLHTIRFVDTLKTRGIEHLSLRGEINQAELLQLILLLAKRQQPPQSPQNSTNLRFGSIDMSRTGQGEGATRVSQPSTESALLHCERDRLEEICSGASKNRPLSVTGLKEIVIHFLQALDQELDPLLAIFPLHKQDQYSFTHSTNVCLLTLAHARRLGLKGSLLHDIGIAALLHDIGKLFLPVDIINKPGKPNDEEWQMIRLHPVRGAEYLVGTAGVPQLAVVTAYEHHMKYDLTGYPTVKKNWQQHLCSHMTTIADIFDALRTKRSYREAMNASKVRKMLSELAGQELHPELCSSFLQMIDEVTIPPSVAQTP